MKLQCLRPLRIFESTDGSKSTRYTPKTTVSEQTAPCGYCFPCLKEKRRQWSIRLSLESLMHEHQCFITLTYKNAPLSLNKKHCQDFLKRLRKHLKSKITYFLVGEYGSSSGRAHYHLILFGHDFKSGSHPVSDKLYSHPLLEKTWSHGHVSIGSVTPASINYVASYTQKKLTKIQNDRFFDKINGEIREREFNLMSKSPAIGRTYYNKYKYILDNDPSVVIDGKKMFVPNYFNRISDKQFTDAIQFNTNIIDNDDLETKIQKSLKLSRAELRSIKQKEIL